MKSVFKEENLFIVLNRTKSNTQLEYNILQTITQVNSYFIAIHILSNILLWDTDDNPTILSVELSSKSGSNISKVKLGSSTICTIDISCDKTGHSLIYSKKTFEKDYLQKIFKRKIRIILIIEKKVIKY